MGRGGLSGGFRGPRLIRTVGQNILFHEGFRYVATPPNKENSILLVTKCNYVPASSGANSSKSRNQNGSDMPLLPTEQNPCVRTRPEPLKPSQSLSKSGKPNMTWAERVKAITASSLEKNHWIHIRMQNSDSVPRNSLNLAVGPGEQMASKGVSD